MVLIIVFLILPIIQISPVFADPSEEVVDFFDSSWNDGPALLEIHPSATGLSAAGQCFNQTKSSTYKITKVAFRIKKIGNPNGTANAVLYAITGTYGTNGEPTGSPLATSDGFDISTFTTSWVWYNFTFNATELYIMQPNTQYCIDVEIISGSVGASDYFRLDATLSGTHSGNIFTYYASDWHPQDTYDIGFYVYGYPSNTYTLSITSFPNGVNFTINGTNKTTPYSDTLENATYQINFTSSLSRGDVTWNFAYWDDNQSNTNPDRTLDLQSDTSLSVTYSLEWAPLEYTGSDPVFECAMNNMFELNGILEGNYTYRQMLLDTSAYENHGKIYPLTHPYAGPELTWGRIGQALEFDGVDDSVIIDDSDSLDILDAITIEFWFMVYNATPNQKILCKHPQWIIGIENSKLYIDFFTTLGNNYEDKTSSEDIEEGVFYFVSLTYDYRDGYYTVYLHGVPAFNVTTDGNKIQDLNANLYLGNNLNTSYWFNGVIDEVRIFPYKRTYDEIYTDARTAISRFDSWSFVNSGTSSDGSTWTVVEGTTNDYQDFTNNDPALPWAYSNNTHPYTFVRTLKYVAGFQQYQSYCTVKFDSDDSNVGLQSASYVSWYWNFFKNGRLQVSYDVVMEPLSWGNDPTYGDYVVWWYLRFRRTTPYFETEEIYYRYLTTNYTYIQKEMPIIVSAWIGPDNKHFTIRVDVQDTRVYTALGPGDVDLPFTHSFDLIDENLNPHILDWFDGWVVSGIKVRSNRITSGTWAKMEIQSHKLEWWQTVLSFVSPVAGIATYLLFPQVEEVVNVVVEEVVTVLQPVAEVIGTAVREMGDPIVDALSGLAHDFIGAIGGLGTFIGDALAPLSSVFTSIGTTIVNAFISFMHPILTAIVNTAQLMGESLVDFIDSVFGWFGFPDAFSNFLNFLVDLGAWLVTSMTWLVSSLTSVFTFIGAIMGKFLNTTGTVVGVWVDIFQGVFDVLGGSLTAGINIWNDFGLSTWIILIAIFYPIYLIGLWETKGIDAVINQLRFLTDVMAWIIRIFVLVVQTFIDVIGRLIESIPIVE